MQSDPNTGDILAVHALSDDGRIAVTVGSNTGSVTVWNVTTGDVINHLKMPSVRSGSTITYSRIALDPLGTHAFFDALYTQDTPYLCSRIRYDLNLGNGSTVTNIIKTTPVGKNVDTLTPAESAICDENWGADALPIKPNPRGWSITQDVWHAANGYAVIDTTKKVVQRLGKRPAPSFDEVSVSPDARLIVLSNLNDGGADAASEAVVAETLQKGAEQTSLTVFNLVTSRFLPTKIVLPASYNDFIWLDNTHFMALFRDDAPSSADTTLFPPARFIDATSGLDYRPPIPPACFMKPLSPDTFVGMGLANCSASAPKAARGLMRYDPGKGWQSIAVPALAKYWVTDLSVSPDHTSVAVVLSGIDDNEIVNAGVKIIEISSGRVLSSTLEKEVEGYAYVRYLRDGRVLITSYTQDHGKRWLWRPGDRSAQPIAEDGIDDRTDSYDISESDGTVAIRTRPGIITRVNIATGRVLPAIRMDGIRWSGLTADGKIFWATSETNGIAFWDTQTWKRMMTVYAFWDQHYFTVTPNGRYDTNLGPDTNAFRWLADDAPFQSLAPQTFMRDYFQPQLATKVLDRSTHFKPVPNILSLNRVLPTIRAASSKPGPTPDIALVTVEVENGTNADAPKGKTDSGMYNLRLFRNNKLVAEWPSAGADTGGQDILAWRKANALPRDADGVARASFTIHLPTGTDAGVSNFSAYVFNEDRVKSETVSFSHIRWPITPRPPRAYVLTIGINAYDTPRLKLQYAANDAQILSNRLAKLPGYDVRRLALVGTDRRITKAVIAAAIGLLANDNRSQNLALLSAAGINGSEIEAATPDDLVVVSFAGHGWADAQSNFFVLAADALWPDTAALPDNSTLISSAELTAWLRRIDAGDMALIIDACHSAASVDALGFKPGPMGDAGLGQLAYDKGIRVLAATQTDDVAFEDADLKQGLLSYALTGKGITDGGFGEADLNNDRRIMLDEWLQYAVKELPILSSDTRLRHFGAGFGGPRHVTIISDSQAEAPKPQEPALFDFNSQVSTVVLRTAKP